MMIIDGKAIAAEKLEKLKLQIAHCSLPIKLVGVMVGEDPASKMYLALKKRRAEEVGIASEVIVSTEKEIRDLIKKLNDDKTVTGILVQLPLPDSLWEKTQEIVDLIDPVKDVDCLTSANMGLLAVGQPRYYPATVKAVLACLDNVEGKNVVVIGRSAIVGKPLAMALIGLRATVTVANRKTADLGKLTREADILISATGVEHLIKVDMVRPGAVVIDCGSPKAEVDPAVMQIASAMTPVPGGVGPLTVVSLLENTLQAAKMSNIQ